MKLRKRKDGLWTTQVKISKGKYKSVYGKTQRECKEKANRLIAEVETGTYVKDSKMTVADWESHWEKTYLGNIRESSRITYLTRWRIYLAPAIGDKRISSVTLDDVQTLARGLTDKGLSPSTVKGVVRTLSRMMSDAAKAGLIKSNPCQGVTYPKEPRSEKTVLGLEEVPGFLEAAKSASPHSDFFEFLLLTGLRVSEAIGLTFDRVDFKAGAILVDRQWHVFLDKFTQTKGGEPRRIVLCRRAREILGDRRRLSESRAEESEGYNPSSFAFFTDDGRRLNYRTMVDQFQRITSTAGKEGMTIHDLRHTFATLALAAGVDVKTLQETLGHKSASMTLDLYSHSTDEMKVEAAGKLDELFGK